MTTLSGWCLRPLSSGSKKEHARCPQNFARGACTCGCGHEGARVWEEVDNEAPAVYAKKRTRRVGTVQEPPVRTAAHLRRSLEDDAADRSDGEEDSLEQ